VKGESGVQAGGLLGNTVIFIYKDNDAAKIKDVTQLNLMANEAQKQICSGKDTRDLIVNEGMSILFVYPTKSGAATVLKINRCPSSK
jgi:hypothetical protein